MVARSLPRLQYMPQGFPTQPAPQDTRMFSKSISWVHLSRERLRFGLVCRDEIKNVTGVLAIPASRRRAFRKVFQISHNLHVGHREPGRVERGGVGPVSPHCKLQERCTVVAAGIHRHGPPPHTKKNIAYSVRSTIQAKKTLPSSVARHKQNPAITAKNTQCHTPTVH